jgi:DivIVA domain-containing protein
MAPFRLTPRDLEHQKFARRLRGYDPDEVDRFLSAASDDLEAAGRECEQLKRRVATLEAELGDLHDLERSLRDALVLAAEAAKLAQRRADAVLDEAELKRQDLIRDAERRCREMLGAAEAKRHALGLDIEALARRRSYLLSRLRSLVDEQRAILKADEERAERDGAGPARLIPIPAPRGATAVGDGS